MTWNNQGTMLLVAFHIDDHRYAVDSSQVIEIVPVVRFKELPGAPDYIRGIFRFRGQTVPVVDLSTVAGKKTSRPCLSTRIILVEYPVRQERVHILGLLAERVTNTIKIDSQKVEASGVRVDDAPFLGGLIPEENMTQLINPRALLPDQVKELLFPEDG